MRFIVDVLRRILGKPYRLETLPPKVLKRVLKTQDVDNMSQLVRYGMISDIWDMQVSNAQQSLEAFQGGPLADYDTKLQAIGVAEKWRYDFVLMEQIGREIARVRWQLKQGDAEPAKAFLRSKYRMKLRWRYDQILD